MQYMHYPVSPLLKNHVNGISVITGEVGGQSITYFADGSPGIIYFQSEKQLQVTDQSLNPFFLYGQTVKPITLMASTTFRMIVFSLSPTALHTLFRIDAQELTDTCLDGTLLPGVLESGIALHLEERNALHQQVDSISAWIGSLVRGQQTVLTNPVHYATTQLVQTNGTLPLQEIQKELKVCQRTFQRKFEQQVGVSPRLFARICRFQHSLALVKANGFEKLSDIAYETGYADQSHFIRTFKEFTGLTPLEFKKSLSPSTVY